MHAHLILHKHSLKSATDNDSSDVFYLMVQVCLSQNTVGYALHVTNVKIYIKFIM